MATTLAQLPAIPANQDCATCSLRQFVFELLERVEELEKRNAELEKRNAELEARLAKYENAHTPPSLKEGNKVKSKSGSAGRPKGYEGSTRPTAEPERVIGVTMEECPKCHSVLGNPVKVESRIIEEIPVPKPIAVTEFRVAHYDCPSCGEHVIARHPECPTEGRFGPRALAHITLLKYDDRLPHRKVCRTLKREFGLDITPATVLDVTRRVSHALKDEYEGIKKRIRESEVVYIDETSIRVNGDKYWIWAFTTETDTLVVIRHSRGKNVLKEVLGRKFKGIIVCDGHRSYSNFTRNLQRCWAHILREARFVAEKEQEAEGFSKGLHRLYGRLVDAMAEEPPPDERARLYRNALAVLRYWLGKEYTAKRVVKFVAKVKTAMKHLLTFVLNPGVEPTNNRAERALREHVVIRKIIGTLRNEKGTSIHETVMSCLVTWRQQGLNPYEEIVRQVC
jgi:transposase